MTAHLQIHWPVVTSGNACEARGDGFDLIALMFRNECAAAWEQHCKVTGSDFGNGLARVVVIVDIAPDGHGEPVRQRVSFS